MRKTVLCSMLTVIVAVAGVGVTADDVVVTGFEVLVGFPTTTDEAAQSGVLLMPGTLVPLALERPDEATVERSLALLTTVDKLWTTFRLDPDRVRQKGSLVTAEVGVEAPVATPDGVGVTVAATLLGCNDQAATYRIRFRQGERVLADSTVNVTRRGRAVVGGMDGEEAPYIFLLVEPDPPGVDRSTIPFVEGGELASPELIKPAIMPVYPEEARKGRVMGTVVLRLVIDENGTVVDATGLESPDPTLTVAAVEAVRQWRFRPATRRDGSPVKVVYVVTVKFALK